MFFDAIDGEFKHKKNTFQKPIHRCSLEHGA